MLGTVSKSRWAIKIKFTAVFIILFFFIYLYYTSWGCIELITFCFCFNFKH